MEEEEEEEEEVIKKKESKKENSKSIFSNQIPYSITGALGAPTTVSFLPSFSLLYAPPKPPSYLSSSLLSLIC